MSRLERLKRFTVDHKETAYIYRKSLEAADIPEKNDFVNGYHGDVGPGWEVTSTVEGAKGSEYLQLKCSGKKWNDSQKALNDSLQFVPTPDADLPAGRPGILVCKKSVIDSNVTVGNTQWRLAFARIQKSPLKIKDNPEVVVNDVILTWEHPEWPDYMVSCWKWFAS